MPRRRARCPLSHSTHHNRAPFSDDSEESSDIETPPKRRPGRNQTVQDVLQQRNRMDDRRLKAARERANQQHADVLHTQNRTLDAILSLTTEIKGLREDNRTARDARDSSRTSELLAEIVSKKF